MKYNNADSHKDNNPLIYFDHAASTPLSEVAKNSLIKALEVFGNSSAGHPYGVFINQKLEECRKSFYEFLEAKKTYDCTFTSSATESNNLIIFGLNLKAGDIVYYHPFCHPSQVYPLFELENNGIILKKLKANNGVFDYSQEIEVGAKLIVLAHVNSQSGIELDLDKFKNWTRQLRKEINLNNVHIHLDCSQSFGKVYISLKDNFFDSITLSGHKMGAPKGISVLFHKRYSIKPITFGGGQEFGFRSGTSNFPLIKSFSDHSKNFLQKQEEYFEKVKSLKLLLIDGIKNFPNVVEVFDRKNTSPYIFCFALKGIENKEAVKILGDMNIMIATSSACSSNRDKLNEAQYFNSLDIPEELHSHILRISFSYLNTKAEIERLISGIKTVVSNLS